MNYLIIDLECTCWEYGAPAPKETIEMGAVMYDRLKGVIDEFQAFVRPSVECVLSDFCVQLTQIKQDDVDDASVFPEVFAALVAWARDYEPYTLASWGAFDHKQMCGECERHGIEYPFTEHYNIKQMFADAMGIKPCGMARALRHAKLPLVGTHHRGIDDARNIARLFAHIHESP